MAAIFAPPSNAATGMNPYAAGGAGFAAGIAVDRGAMAFSSARRRANWALGIAVGLTLLAGVSSSNLNADQAAAQATVTTASALVFSAAVVGLEVAALRSVVVAQGGLLAKIAYDANLLAFSGSPTPPTAPIQIAAITQPAAVTTSSNNNIILVALGVLVVLAVFYAT